MAEKTVFKEITNEDIYNEIKSLRKHVMVTNGKVKINKLYSRVALVISLVAITIVTGVNLVAVLS